MTEAPQRDNIDRQRDAEALANAQIPGLAPENEVSKPNTDAAPAKRDVIDVSGAPVEAPSDAEIERITEDVINQLKSVYDPEIPVDIYELGLIYKVELEDDRLLKVQMTLTAPGCPVAGEMPEWVREACEVVAGVRKCEVSMTFDPPWTMERMSDEAKLELNML
ncbi:SUF system Fe-S cluster assembly protein [Robiginitomaculum antarcticum]|uniref:SUF system Fe-S cluster assembly protein n=1 Tax=Robiginitomaculum antarcticum TaxID=437507 RepID=UPI00035F1459|nr:SUF system Fe-S cluster assembly protein [Robiginitomaculum antarcticum]